MRISDWSSDVCSSDLKPIILAAQGTCLGAGMEMVMSCDFRFCTPSAEWAVPEIRLGVLQGSGGSSRLARIVGPAWAKYLAIAGRPAYRLGGTEWGSTFRSRLCPYI